MDGAIDVRLSALRRGPGDPRDARVRTAPIRYDPREDEDDEWDASPTAIAGGEEALRIAYAAVPYACADWGLRRMRFDPPRSCLEVEDGLGGTYHQCVDPREDRYTVEAPG